MRLLSLGAKRTSKGVVGRDEEAAAARVALASGAAEKLAVDAARLVALHADDVHSAQFRDAGTEDDVGAAAGHVRGDGHRAAMAGRAMISASARSCLPLSSSSGRPSAARRCGQQFAVADRPRSDEHGAAGMVYRDDLGDHGPILRFGVDEEPGGQRFAAARLSQGDRQHGQPEMPLEFAAAAPTPCRSCRRSFRRAGRIAAERSCAAVRNSGEVSSPSLASTDWCSPSRHVRWAKMRPVNSSTSITRPSCTT